MVCFFTVGAIVIEGKYPTCPSWESNPGRWIYRPILYHVPVKDGFYRKAVKVYLYIPSPCDISFRDNISVKQIGSHSSRTQNVRPGLAKGIGRSQKGSDTHRDSQNSFLRENIVSRKYKDIINNSNLDISMK